MTATGGNSRTSSSAAVAARGHDRFESLRARVRSSQPLGEIPIVFDDQDRFVARQNVAAIVGDGELCGLADGVFAIPRFLSLVNRSGRTVSFRSAARCNFAAGRA